MDRTELNAAIIVYRSLLRLEDWFFDVEELGEDWDSPAYVTFDRENKRATLHVRLHAVTRDNVAHEMLHVLFYDMSFLACNGRSVEVMDMYNMYEERACNVLSTLLD